ncbi:MAG TPA: response regulator [Anaerolineae bacterium]|nr:response regulator [Anaerolineae bacterium]
MATPLVFIVEDDKKLSEIYSLTLQAAGLRTEQAADGQAALTRLAEIIPDLIILDLHLPNVAGPDILRYIRSNEHLCNTRVILATADERLAETLDDQASLVLLKPVSPEQLRLFVSRLLKSDAN